MLCGPRPSVVQCRTESEKPKKEYKLPVPTRILNERKKAAAEEKKKRMAEMKAKKMAEAEKKKEEAKKKKDAGELVKEHK